MSGIVAHFGKAEGPALEGRHKNARLIGKERRMPFPKCDLCGQELASKRALADDKWLLHKIRSYRNGETPIWRVVASGLLAG